MSQDAAMFSADKRGGRRLRLTLLAATASAVFVGVNAPAALASDGTEPIPPVGELVPEIPELEADTAPESMPLPDVEEPPIVIATAAAENAIDVSVRVLSPDTDAPTSPDNGSDSAIPPVSAPDITPDPAPATTPAEPTSAAASIPLNTNVSIRVLSPGNDGFVSQEDLSDVAPETVGSSEAEGNPQPDRASPPEDRNGAGNDSTQYQDENSQYQSDSVLLEEPWIWEWYLALDCTGVTSSISTEIGTPSSDNWAWDWEWNWGCGFDGASEAAGDAMQESVPYTISSTSSPAPGSAPSNEGQPTAEASWIWTWTFTFCGRETTISLRTQTDLLFNWTWDWTWAWACTAAATGGADSGSSPESPSTPGTTPWPDTAAGGEGTTTEAEGGSSRLGLPPPLIALLGPLLDPISIAEAVIPPAVPAVAIPQIAPDETTPRAVPVLPALPISAAADDAPPPTAAGATTSQSAPERASTRATRSARDRKAAPQRARLPRLPVDPPKRRTAGGPSSSGSASSTTSGGVAALTALYLLAAPGLGRRIRITRELSPRDPVRAPLDRPG